jgi:hypothetical protein
MGLRYLYPVFKYARLGVSTLRTDGSVISGDPRLGEPSREGPTVAQLVELFLTAYPINGEQRLHRHLGSLGVTDPADLTPAKLAEFRDHVFRSAKQAGIKDPAAWILHRAQVEPKVSKTQCPVRVKATAGQPKSAESEPVALVNPPTAPAASAPPPAPRTVLYGTTKAEVLSGTKAAVEAGAPPRDIAERLAFAQEDFHATQREMARAIGWSPSTVNRLLRWRQSGYSQRSHFGHTTRAARAAHRKSAKVLSDARANSGSRGKAQRKLKHPSR